MADFRVVSLQASNIMRLSAVEFGWDRDTHVLTIGGKNGAGKSSVLNAIAMALGGLSLCPEEPLKRGESRGFVELNLGELLVRREFWRDLLTEQPKHGPRAYGETKSRLVVKNPEGARQEPAQRLLDKLIGKLSFDPTAFALEDEKKQADILRQIVGLDFKDHDEARNIAYDRRGVFNKQYKEQLVLLDAMPKYDGVPDEEVSVSELTAELDAAEQHRQKVAHAQKWHDNQVLGLSQLRHESSLYGEKIRELTEQIKELSLKRQRAEDELEEHERMISATERSIAQAAKSLRDVEQALPDVRAINARLHELEDTNNKIRANTARRRVMDTVVKFQKAAEEQDAELHRLDELKAKKIREAHYPIEGLGISPTGAVTFNNISLKQASTAEQIRVSVAIGFALNPTLKLLCVKNGNALDEDSFKLVAEAAERAGGQVLMEVVTKDADDVSVFIEDGHS